MMRDLLEKMKQFAGEPEQKPGDQVRGTEVATKGDKHPFLKRLVGELKKPKVRNLEKEIAEAWLMFQEEDLGVEPRRPARPGSREEQFGRRGHKEESGYKSVKEQIPPPATPGNPGATTQPGKPGAASNEPDAATAKPGQAAPGAVKPGQSGKPPVDPATAAALKTSLSKLKTSVPGLDVTKASNTMAKADTGVKLSPGDQAVVSKMAPQLANVIKNPHMISQLKMMIDKANQQEIAQAKQQGTQ
jgi:hypothetical protein